MDTKEQIRDLPLSQIKTDGVQTRASLRDGAIEEYAELVRRGEDLDPGVVYLESKTGDYWLAAGHHRFESYKRANRDSMPCIVRSGGRWEAIEAGIADNLQHRGVRLSQRDKAHAVQLILRERPELSDRSIATKCSVHHDTVAKYRAFLERNRRIRQFDTRVGADGKVRAMPTPRVANCDSDVAADLSAKSPAASPTTASEPSAPRSDSPTNLPPEASRADSVAVNSNSTAGNSAQAVAAAKEALGKLTNRVGILDSKCASARFHACRSLIRQIGEHLDEWEKEAKAPRSAA